MILAALLAIRPGTGQALEVAASIAPVQSLVMGVMGDTGTPALLIPGGQSPHTFALRPSTAHAIADARIVFRIGPNFEASLNEALASSRTRVVDLIDAPGLVLYASRDLDELSIRPRDGLKGHLLDDPHIWLDPDNARAMVRAIATALSAADPPHVKDYRDNEALVEEWIGSLDQAIRAEIKPALGHRFIVFHDAYQYFERRYGLEFGDAVSEMPGRSPGARHIHRVREEIKSANVSCVFSEPQFEPKLVATITEGLNVRVGVLDSLGAEMKPSPDLYFNVMRGLSRSMADCLSPK